ncbi:MAG: aminoacyl-tRNA hydrolase [Proteobacteria bacterium]|nr:aminoacyl-tRNA hydrolase [Pseudomonadota bacterium]
MLLFAGLGNPGTKYAGNRHNIGFMAVDAIVRRHGFSAWRKKFQSEASEGVLDGEKVLLLKPQTYMNESGRAVGEAVRFHGIAIDKVYVFYDELDLEPGKVRLKTGGGAAGHNGIRSIAAHIGPDFKRVRLGIGHPGIKELVMPHVLGDFAKADREWLAPILESVADHAGLLVEGRDETFQSKVHLALHPPRPNAPRKKDNE